MLSKNQYFLVGKPDSNYSLVDKSDKGEPAMFSASSLSGNVHVAQASIPERKTPFSQSADKKYVVKFSPTLPHFSKRYSRSATTVRLEIPSTFRLVILSEQYCKIPVCL